MEGYIKYHDLSYLEKQNLKISLENLKSQMINQRNNVKNTAQEMAQARNNFITLLPNLLITFYSLKLMHEGSLSTGILLYFGGLGTELLAIKYTEIQEECVINKVCEPYNNNISQINNIINQLS